MDEHTLTTMTPVWGMKIVYISLFLKLFQNKWKYICGEFGKYFHKLFSADMKWILTWIIP